MIQEIILPGDDAELQITLTDELGTAIPLGDLEGLEVEFCSDFGNRLHKLNPGDDDKSIALDNAVNGVFSLVLDRIFTAKFAGRTFDCDITVIFDETGNAAFPDGERHLSIFWKDYIKIKEEC